ncbi:MULTISPECIES: copper amine oxidase N-terminal domain-containing protein [unclassified Paenibacillus]|uniref:copper amine oxidase N-terminal domain-containing protein n=1 Tax=unclassified Paenibacillus TaxID=185978 RepID=UPI0036390247
MNNRNKLTWISLFLVVMLIVLAGCQPVNGLDLNKVFQNGVNVKSVQGTQSFTVEITPNSSVTPTADEQKMLDLFSKVNLTLTDIKQQDLTHYSAKGVFEYKKGQIPFQVYMSDDGYVILIEGAKKPIVIQTNMAGMQQFKEGLSQELEQQFNDLRKRATEFAPSIVSYFIGVAPNPKTITVNDGKATIHNENLKGKDIHLEIKGGDLLELVKGFLTNVLADEKGLKELLGQIYDLYAPLMKQTIKESNQEGNPFNDTIAPFLNNRTLAIEFSFTAIQTYLKQMLDNYDQSVQELMSSPGGENVSKILSDSQYLKMDLFVDSEQTVRKSNMELGFSISDSTSTVKGIKINTTSEVWDINKPVAADKIDTSKGQLELPTLGKPGRIISVVDPKSKLYTLLKEDINITKKEINMLMESHDDYAGDSSKPYNSNGTIMVPVRFVVEQLDADVAWEQATQKVTITDLVSGVVINLNVGSKQATVNGMIKMLEKESELTNGSTYVPIRFIAESMGAKVNWNQELQMVTITRD